MKIDNGFETITCECPHCGKKVPPMTKHECTPPCPRCAARDAKMKDVEGVAEIIASTRSWTAERVARTILAYLEEAP